LSQTGQTFLTDDGHKVGLRQARFFKESAAERRWPSTAEGAARFSLGTRQAWGIHGPAKYRKIPTARGRHVVRVVRLRATPEITVDRALDDEGDDDVAAGAGAATTAGVETVTMEHDGQLDGGARPLGGESRGLENGPGYGRTMEVTASARRSPETRRRQGAGPLPFLVRSATKPGTPG
jgi:hypothetical protein